MDTRFLDALACKNKGRPPIWLMRQAGRYMPEYRALRAKHSFLDMCHRPELAAEVTQLPIKAFGFDAAILFSDILVVAEALEVGLRFEEQKGPIIERPVRTKLDVDNLPKVEAAEKLDYVAKAIRLLTPELKIPLIGFAGAPFTVASYMIEGASSRTLQHTKRWMFTDPAGFHALLDHITTLTIDYLKLQVKAGVHAIQLFESWANYLAFPQFAEFSLHYLKKIADALKSTGTPLILFGKGSSAFAQELAKLSPAGIGIDWNADLSSIRKTIPASIALQGNLDPDVLFSSPSTVEKEAKRILQGMHGDPGHIFNLGHGILPETPVDSVKALVNTVKQW